MTDEGWLPDDILRDEVATRSELTKTPKRAAIAVLFDYSIIRENLRAIESERLATGPVRHHGPAGENCDHHRL